MRIDTVHYCKLEGTLAEKRKRAGRFDKNGVPEDPALARLRLLRRTVRDDPTRLGKLVQFLKIPYMLREAAYLELAQTIAVLPNLHYVDLPEGMFSDDPSLATLRLEVQARCPNIRKTTYSRGSERSLAQLAAGRIWPQLEVLELNKINVDPKTLRSVLGSLVNLRALKISQSQSFSDEVLVSEDGTPSLGALEELVLKDTPRVTVPGLVAYLAWQETQEALKVLTLNDTGVNLVNLQDVLNMATSLKTLAVQATVTEAFPHKEVVQPLASRTLETFRFEISEDSEAGAYAHFEAGYYQHLSTSILGGGFPQLRRLYVLDDTMPEQLQGLPPPNAAFAGGRTRPTSFTPSINGPLSPNLPSNGHLRTSSGPLSPASSNGPLSPSIRLSPPRRQLVSNVPPTNRFSSNNPFATHAHSFTPPVPTHTLEVFTKSDEFGQWNFSQISSRHHRTPSGATSSRRPMSFYGLAADVEGMGWDQGEARRSVMVGSGTGGFLAVPDGVGDNSFGGRVSTDSGFRPQSSGRDSVKSSRDLWR